MGSILQNFNLLWPIFMLGSKCSMSTYWKINLAIWSLCRLHSLYVCLSVLNPRISFYAFDFMFKCFSVVLSYYPEKTNSRGSLIVPTTDPLFILFGFSCCLWWMNNRLTCFVNAPARLLDYHQRAVYKRKNKQDCFEWKHKIQFLFVMHWHCLSFMQCPLVTNANARWSIPKHSNSGQSYKHFMLVSYESRVVRWGIFKSCTTLES